MNSLGLLRQTLCGLLAACLLGACAFGADTAETKKSGVTSSRTRDAAKEENTGNSIEAPATDPAYRLSKGDEIAVSVFNEPEFSSAQRIDNRGVIRIPYVGEISIANQTVREAEKYLEKLFVDKKLLREPMVSIGVREYAVREISVLGAMNSTGKFRLPREASSVEMIELVTQMGGLKATARGNDVQVTRVDEDGKEQVHRVDVEAMINPRRADRNTPRSFLLYPGDRIFVPERLF
jgi:protein involved in polysaccharide export with SLBB domain